MMSVQVPSSRWAIRWISRPGIDMDPVVGSECQLLFPTRTSRRRACRRPRRCRRPGRRPRPSRARASRGRPSPHVRRSRVCRPASWPYISPSLGGRLQRARAVPSSLLARDSGRVCVHFELRISHSDRHASAAGSPSRARHDHCAVLACGWRGARRVRVRSSNHPRGTTCCRARAMNRGAKRLRVSSETMEVRSRGTQAAARHWRPSSPSRCDGAPRRRPARGASHRRPSPPRARART